MREVFKLHEPAEPAQGVHYTITRDDVGRSAVIVTTAGAIPVSEILGKILKGDVGKRFVYAGTVWHVENDKQRDERLGRA